MDRSLTAARGLAKVRRQRGKRLYDSVELGTESSDWMDFIAIVVYYDEPFLKNED